MRVIVMRFRAEMRVSLEAARRQRANLMGPVLIGLGQGHRSGAP